MGRNEDIKLSLNGCSYFTKNDALAFACYRHDNFPHCTFFGNMSLIRTQYPSVMTFRLKTSLFVASLNCSSIASVAAMQPCF